jgi:ATP-binding cassette subfamily C exporter for protease/lipase
MNRRQAPTELKSALRTLQPFLVRAFGFAVVAGVLAFSATLYMFEVYDRVLNSRNLTTLAMLTLAVLFCYAVMEALHWAQSETLREAGALLDRQLAVRVYQATHASGRQGGASPLQPMGDLRSLREILCSGAMGAAMELPLCVAFLLLIFLISPVLGWAAVVGAVVQVALGWANERLTQPLLVAANHSAIQAHAHLDGLLRHAEVIASMGMQADIHRRWAAPQRQGMGLQALASNRAGTFQALTRFMQNTLSSLMIGLGAWLLLRDELRGGPGMLIVGSMLGGRLLAPLVQLVSQWTLVVNARDAWMRLEQLLQAHPLPKAAMPLPAPAGRLSVESLFVAPPGSAAPLLKGIHFALRPGEVLIVVGPTAAGKTTLARALTGFWPVASGKVRLDGVDVHGWDPAELGPHLGYLPQRVGLLDGTLAENIARFGDVDMTLVRAAAAAAGLHEAIALMPDGYATPVGRDGAALSGGLRQRVALARAIYADPALVVLDEPNSSLDAAGDEGLARAILALKARGTAFVVMSHRTSVLAIADKILVLGDGVQKAFGSRDEVLAAMGKASAPPAVATTVAAAPQAAPQACAS